MNHKTDMNVGRESDGRVLPGKYPNKDGKSSTEGAEGRRPAKENTGQTTASQMQSWGNALDGLDRVRKAAKRDKRLRFTALLHHVSVALLSNSFYALKREAVPGVDGLTWQEYETDLDKRLEDLHSRVHRGTYRALPSKRAYIPKMDGRQRPLGIAALEDKIVQHAVPGNIASLRNFRFEVSKLWWRVIRRRSQRSRITWELMNQFVSQWLPCPTRTRYEAYGGGRAGQMIAKPISIKLTGGKSGGCASEAVEPTSGDLGMSRSRD